MWLAYGSFVIGKDEEQVQLMNNSFGFSLQHIPFIINIKDTPPLSNYYVQYTLTYCIVPAYDEDYGIGEYDTIYSHINSAAKSGYRKKKRRRPRKKNVVHILDCHDGHDCHGDDSHVISFDHYDSHDDHSYHDYHNDYHNDYHDHHGSYDYHYGGGHDDYDHYDYHDDDHGGYHYDYHDDHHGGGGYGHKSVYKPKVVIIKKVISQSTTTQPLPPTQISVIYCRCGEDMY